MSSLTFPTLSLALSSLASGPQTLKYNDPSSNENTTITKEEQECITKKTIACIPKARRSLEKGELRALQKSEATYFEKEQKDLLDLEALIRQTEDLEECLFIENRLPKEFNEQNMNYFTKYIEFLKQEVKELENFKNYIDLNLFLEEYFADLNKTKYDFEKLERDLEEAKQIFKDLKQRNTSVKLLDSFKLFLKKALKNGNITCNPKKLMTIPGQNKVTEVTRL